MIKKMFDQDVTYEQVFNLPSAYLIADTSRKSSYALDVLVQDKGVAYCPLAIYTSLDNALAAAQSLGLRAPAWLRILEDLLNWGPWRKPYTYQVNGTHKILKGSLLGALAIALRDKKDYLTFDPHIGALGDPVFLIPVESLVQAAKAEQ